MRAVIQRVHSARVEVDGEVTGRIDEGLMVLLGVEAGDTDRDLDYVVRKISGMRIFEDEQGRMNQSVAEVGGAVLLVSQFTLIGDCRKGRRPSFARAMDPAEAADYCDRCRDALIAEGLRVECGRFGAMMDVHLVNNGPVTLLVDSRKAF